MELLSELTSKLGVNEDQAKGLAGGLLGMIQSQVKSGVGEAEAQQFSESVPEVESWKSHVPESSGGLMGLAGGLLGGSEGGLDVGGIAKLAGGLNLDASSIQSLLPTVLSFLRSRLDDGLLSKVLGAVPLLSGGSQAGGIAGAVGKLFG